MSFIETERLLLRTWMIPGDVDDAFELYGDSEVMRFIPRPVAADRADAAAAIEELMRANEREGFSLWPVVAKDLGRVIGLCGVFRRPEDAELEIGWMFKRSVWGKGYGIEAATAVRDYTFAHLHAPRLHALIDRENTASISLANRLGMRFERIVRAAKRDAMCYVAVAPS